MKKGNFPTTIETFNTYVIQVFAYILKNAARLKIDPADIAAFTNLMGDSTLPGTYIFLWQLYADRDMTRTSNVIKQLALVTIDIKKLLAKVYGDIPTSLWTDNDRNTFQRKKGLKIVFTPLTSPITQKCFAKTVPMGQGDIKFSFKNADDDSRPCKVQYADAIEIAYKLVPKPAAPADDSKTELKPHQTMISGPNDGTTNLIFSKAINIAHFGKDSSGMFLQFFARWLCIRHPELSSPWTGPFSQMIL